MRFLPPPAWGPVVLVLLLILPAASAVASPSLEERNEAWALAALQAGARLQGVDLPGRMSFLSWDGESLHEGLETPRKVAQLIARAAGDAALDGLPTEPRSRGSGPVPGENPLVPQTPALTRLAAGDLWLLEWAGYCRIDLSAQGSPTNVGGAGPPAVYEGRTVVVETWTQEGLAVPRTGLVHGLDPEDAPPYTYNVGTRFAGNANFLCTSFFKFAQLDGAAVLYSTNQ